MDIFIFILFVLDMLDEKCRSAGLTRLEGQGKTKAQEIRKRRPRFVATSSQGYKDDIAHSSSGSDPAWMCDFPQRQVDSMEQKIQTTPSLFMGLCRFSSEMDWKFISASGLDPAA